MKEWFDDDDFWLALEPFLFTEERMAAAAGEIDRILELLDFEGRDVLDLCCGAGRHSIDLARRGYTVTGVDRSARFLERARSDAASSEVEVEWVQADMREFSREESFDLVLNMFTSFGYFDDPDEDVQVLRSIHSSLRDGGVLVIETVGKEWLANVFQPTSSDELPDGSLLVQRHEIFDDWSRIRNTWIVVSDGAATSFTFHHTIYSAQELKDRLAVAGFSEVRVYGDLDGSDYGPGAERLIVVAKK